jgi:hypothetical protein
MEELIKLNLAYKKLQAIIITLSIDFSHQKLVIYKQQYKNTMAMKVEDILKWEKEYDHTKYPYEVYKELVIEGKNHPRKIEIMGAWKTGNLQIGNINIQYKDKNGTPYTFNENKWKRGAYARREAWNQVQVNQQYYQENCPLEFPQNKPLILDQLMDIHGLGPIFSIFVLHCMYPRVYPLYDQHVFRAFKYLISNGREIPQKANPRWDEYKAYRDFFVQMVKNTKIEFWRVDKALWAYGKHLASLKPHSEKNKMISKVNNFTPIDIKDGNSWRTSYTLGYSKPFKWCLTNTNDLIISRTFKGGKLRKTTITIDELEKVDRFVFAKADWVDLANNVDKLAKGTEKDGVGRFLHDQLGKNPTDSQLSSHLGALFVNAGIWEYRRKKGMQFRKIEGIDWNSKLREFYRTDINR